MERESWGKRKEGESHTLLRTKKYTHHSQCKTHLDVDKVANFVDCTVCLETNGTMLAEVTRKHVARSAAQTLCVCHCVGRLLSEGKKNAG